MTPVEEMQAAAAKLTAERDAAEEGPFMFLKYDGDQYDMGDIVMGDPGDPVEVYPVVAQQVCATDANLHITLHGTIDVLLLIIRHAIEDYSPGDDCQGFITEDGLALARKINGSVGAL